MKFPKLSGLRIALGAGILLVAMIIGGLGWAFLQQLTLSDELRGETRQLELAVATQRAHQGHLTATLTYVHTDAYVEEWAREEARMARPGEVLVIPIQVSREPEPVPIPTVQPTEEAPPESESEPLWVVWWEALTGAD